MSFEDIYNIILSAVVAIVIFFLKRTITQIDETREKLDKVKLEYTTKDEFQKLSDKIDMMSEKVNNVQLSCISKDDFFVKMSEIAGKLERIEDKIERSRNERA